MTTIPATPSTPEATTAAPSLAKPLNRLGAYGVDCALLFIAAIFLAALFTTTTTITLPDGQVADQTTTGALAVPLMFLMWATYFIVCWCTTGQTLGMRVVNIEVRRLDGRRLDPLGAVGRLVVLWLGISLLGIGVLAALGDRLGQGCHDRAAGTVVVEHAQ